MKIISMVPSWTATLIEAGVDVVGRTRFCIHPSEKVKSIAVVGGTKTIDWLKVNSLAADLLLLDKEENPKTFFDQATLPAEATHVRSCFDVAVELKRLGEIINNKTLLQYSKRWSEVTASFENKRELPLQIHKLSEPDQKSFGLIEWINKPVENYEQIVYVIWKDPFMAVTQETFIGSVLGLVGLPVQLSIESTKKTYPEIELNDFDKKKTLFLFSSEPFPFHKKKDELKKLNLVSAIVDGECFSWFGLRSLKYLELARLSVDNN